MGVICALEGCNELVKHMGLDNGEVLPYCWKHATNSMTDVMMCCEPGRLRVKATFGAEVNNDTAFFSRHADEDMKDVEHKLDSDEATCRQSTSDPMLSNATEFRKPHKAEKRESDHPKSHGHENCNSGSSSDTGDTFSVNRGPDKGGIANATRIVGGRP